MYKKPYFLKGWVKGAILLFLNATFWLFKKRSPIPTALKRIIVCNTASLGDVVIATTVLPVLKRQYPNCEIGFLTSVKTADVLKDHPLVSFHHTIDHWFWNKEQGFFSSLWIYFLDFRRVCKEIKKHCYDLAIDLYPYVFLSSVPLLWISSVPSRAGYPVRGFSNLLTAIASPPPSPQPMGKTHLDLLKFLGIHTACSANPLPSYTHYRQPIGHAPKSYIVVHMGTGYRLKEWNTQKWIALVQKLIGQGEKVILTGKGKEELRRCQEVAFQTGCINACNELSWGQFSSLVQQSKLLISVDSSAVHLASAVCLPCLVLFAGISSQDVWKPPYPLCVALMKRTPCSPCLSHQGCKSMPCIQDIEPEEVLFQARRLMFSMLSRICCY